MFSLKDPHPLLPVLSVSQLTELIKEFLEQEFETILVAGEISNAKLYPSGHWYFSLKDSQATLPCVFFKQASFGLRFKLEDGLSVVAKGRLSVYPPRGAYQMVVTSVEPVGIGEWQLAFEQLKAKLEKEGLLDPTRKRPIPLMPRRIGLVTSTAGAAIKDVLSALARRNRSVSVVISPCRVQGEGSAEEIAQAIQYLQGVPDVEVILVCRGGGSIEDLWAFNTEVVARAVAESTIPVISGVGHETDTTICDLVADLRAPTPTAAAELVAKGSRELLERFMFLEHKLRSSIEDHISDARLRLERAHPLRALLRYQDRLHREHLKVTAWKKSLTVSMDTLLSSSRHRLAQQHHKLVALGPLNVLRRGFSVLRKHDGQVVRHLNDVKAGEELFAYLETGKLRIRIEELLPDWQSGGE